MTTPIRIVRKQNGDLQPETGKRNKLKKGAKVRFSAAPDVAGLEIEFTGASPFGDAAEERRFPYDGAEKTVTKEFIEGGGEQNVYVYVCRAQGQTDPPAPGEGGEIEIERG